MFQRGYDAALPQWETTKAGDLEPTEELRMVPSPASPCLHLQEEQMAEADSRKAGCTAIAETAKLCVRDPLHRYYPPLDPLMQLLLVGKEVSASLLRVHVCPVEKAQMRSILRMLCYVSLG